MKKFRFYLIAGAAALLLNFMMVLQSSTVALITGVEGDVTLFRSGSETKETVTLGTELGKDDLLMAGKNGKATIYFMDGVVVVLNASEQITIGSSSSDSKKNDGSTTRSVTDTDVSLKTKNGFNNLRKNEIASLTPANFRGEGVNAVFPMGFISTTNPYFGWVDSSNAGAAPEERDYVLIILNADEEVVLRKELKGRSLILNMVQIPELALTLSDEMQEFNWDIYPKEKAPAKPDISRVNNQFTLFDAGRSEKINTTLAEYENSLKSGKIDKSTYLIVTGYYLKDQKLFSQAIAAFEELAMMKQGVSFTFQELALLYSAQGNRTGFMVNYYLNKIKSLSAK
ncbi:MAG: hypothetical protein L6Q47_00740 [Ignavibacteriaceae bacterium]|nr:hypothetical protein [Ignavibacteriaceae bacterium]